MVADRDLSRFHRGRGGQGRQSCGAPWCRWVPAAQASRPSAARHLETRQAGRRGRGGVAGSCSQGAIPSRGPTARVRRAGDLWFGERSRGLGMGRGCSRAGVSACQHRRLGMGPGEPDRDLRPWHTRHLWARLGDREAVSTAQHGRHLLGGGHGGGCRSACESRGRHPLPDDGPDRSPIRWPQRQFRPQVATGGHRGGQDRYRVLLARGDLGRDPVRPASRKSPPRCQQPSGTRNGRVDRDRLLEAGSVTNAW